MAVLANITGVDVRRRFARGRNAVVAATAITNNADVIEVRRHPRGRCVTVVAVVAAGHMCGMFAGSYNAVVTGTTGADHLGMIDRGGWNPGDDAMAVLTNGCRLDVRGVLAGRIGAVVATRAVARDIDVIKIRWHPGDRRVAVVAGVATGDVCRGFAGRNISIVTGIASTDYLGVVDRYGRRPKVDAVTILTNQRGLNVRDMFAGRVRAVMAVGAVTGDAGVIKIGRRPGDSRVAIVAVIATREVGRVFSSSGCAVMT